MSYPYTNFQELNLDWFLEEWEEFKALWNSTQTALETTQQDLIDAVNAKIEEIDNAI